VTSPRWDGDERGRGVADARGSLDAIRELEVLADSAEWVAEDPEEHLLPGLREAIERSGLRLESTVVELDGMLLVRLTSSAGRSRRELRQAVWSILGGVVELASMVRETHAGNATAFEVVTGNPPGGRFATHGHTLRIEVGSV
jgi:hypothetical protein